MLLLRGDAKSSRNGPVSLLLDGNVCPLALPRRGDVEERSGDPCISDCDSVGSLFFMLSTYS